MSNDRDHPSEFTTLFEQDALAPTAAKLAALESFFHAVGRDQKFADFVRELLYVFLKAVPSEAGSVLEVDYPNQAVFFRALAGSSSEKISDTIIPLSQGIVGYVVESQQHLVVDHVEGNQKHLRSVSDAIGFQVRNLVALPLVIRGKTYGVIELLNRVGEEQFSRADIELLVYLVQMAARAIEYRLMLAWAAKSREAA